MEEQKLLVIEHKDLAGRTLIVPKEVSEDGKLTLDEKGQATLPYKAAHFLCTVPGFSIVGESKSEKTKELQQEINQISNPNPPPQPTPEELEAKKLGLQFITEGGQVICVDDEFVNVLESDCAYGATQAEALECYKKEFIESKGPASSDANVDNDHKPEKTDLQNNSVNEDQINNSEPDNQLTEEAKNQVVVDDNLVQELESGDVNQENVSAQQIEDKDQEQEKTQKYPQGDPNPSWKKEELTAWLAERLIEFKPKDGKEVLLGKAFKFLEEKKAAG